MRQLAFASFLALVVVTPIGEASAGTPRPRSGEAVTASATAGASATLAPTATLNLARLDASLSGLPLGQGREAVFAWIRARLERELAPKLKRSLDESERLALRTQLEKDFETLRRSVIPFDGRRTGFETSLIAGEFAAGGNESLLVFREATHVHYLFFSGDVLWKVARPLAVGGADKEAGEATFGERIAAIRQELGPVTSEATAPSAAVDGTVQTEARWAGANATVRLVDQRRIFRSDLLVIEEPTLARAALEARSGTALRGAYELDAETRALLGSDDPIEITEE